MISNTRIAVAAHIVAVLASKPGEFVKSRYVAGSVNTNAAFVRRILCSLTRAGIAEAEMGKSGGSRLVKRPEEITLWDLAVALGEERLFAVHKNPANPRCPISRGIKASLGKAFSGVEKAARAQMKRTSIKELLPA